MTEGPTLGFLLSLRADTFDGEMLARQVAMAIGDVLPVDEIDVTYMGTIDEYPDTE